MQLLNHSMRGFKYWKIGKRIESEQLRYHNNKELDCFTMTMKSQGDNQTLFGIFRNYKKLRKKFWRRKLLMAQHLADTLLILAWAKLHVLGRQSYIFNYVLSTFSSEFVICKMVSFSFIVNCNASSHNLTTFQHLQLIHVHDIRTKVVQIIAYGILENQRTRYSRFFKI